MKKLNSILSLITMGIVITTFMGCGEKSTDENKIDANFNDTGYPIVDEKIELNAMTLVNPMSGDFNNIEILKEIDNKTNIDMKYQCIANSQWAEKKNLTIASGDLPDVFFGGGLSDNDIITMGNNGSLIPLNDLIDKYAPNIKKLFEERPDVKKAITSPDGNIYALPNVDELPNETIPDNLFINKTWLDTLGLEIPTTTEEFFNVLKAFKLNDPNGNSRGDEIPFTYRANQTYTGEMSMFGSFGMVDNVNHLMLKENKLIFTANSEEYKEAIKWFNELYSNGLIDEEVFTQEQSQYTSKGKDDEMVVGAFVIYHSANFVGEERAKNDYMLLPPLKGPKGHQLWNKLTYGINKGYFALTSKNKYPEATIRWINELYDEKTALLVHWGEIGKNIEENDNGYVILDPPKGKSSDQYRYELSCGPHAPGWQSLDVLNKVKFADDNMTKQKNCEVYDKFTVTPIPVLNFTKEEADEIATISTDINNYIMEMKGKWITGQRNINDDWNEYLNNLEKMKVNRYVNLYNQALDRTK